MLSLAAIAWPILLTLLTLPRSLTGSVRWTLPLAPLPALALALSGGESQVHISWLFLGTTLGLGGGGPIFLLLTAGLWSIAGWYAPGYLGSGGRLRRYAFFHLLTCAGNLALVLAEDVPGFYSGFAVMTYAAYGLVVHTGTDEARRAGRVYLSLAILGEMLLLAALLLATNVAGSIRLQDLGPAVGESDSRDLIIALALSGFGVKAGLLPVHVWLPLAHPVAPTPASAVLSGAMIKAGLLGWMHVLPLGHAVAMNWGVGIIALGLTAAFYAVACGLAQRDPKTNLAYSSISQMGVMTTAIGAGLCAPAAWPALAAALGLYALNHAFAKGALFLGVGVSHACRQASRKLRGAVLAELALAALVIAGAPLLGGAIVKDALKYVAAGATETAFPLLVPLLPWTAVATSLLLARFLVLIARELRDEAPHPYGRPVWYGWLTALAAAAGGVVGVTWFFQPDVHATPFSWAQLWSGAWPVLAGLGLLAAAHFVHRRRIPADRPVRVLVFRIPAGDLVVPLEKAVVALLRRARHLPGPEHWQLNIVPVVERVARSRPVQNFFNRVEIALKRWETAGLMLLGLLAVFWWALGRV